MEEPMSCSGQDRDYVELVFVHAVGGLASSEIPVLEEHVASCADCRREMESLRRVVETFVSWPTDLLRPYTTLWERVTKRIADETGQEPLLPAPGAWPSPEWQEAAPGLTYKILAADMTRDRVSLLVRLAPGASYPPHTHADVEELYLLHGELWIDGRKLYPGDYNRGEPGVSDDRVWSETGCTCVLVTSTRDTLR